jgi:small-conductance mechanosensitive channel
VQDVSASGITLVARPFMKFADYGQVQVDLRERIRRRFQEENVDLPHAQYDVHLFQVASS